MSKAEFEKLFFWEILFFDPFLFALKCAQNTYQKIIVHNNNTLCNVVVQYLITSNSSHYPAEIHTGFIFIGKNLFWPNSKRFS